MDINKCSRDDNLLKDNIRRSLCYQNEINSGNLYFDAQMKPIKYRCSKIHRSRNEAHDYFYSPSLRQWGLQKLGPTELVEQSENENGVDN